MVETLSQIPSGAIAESAVPWGWLLAVLVMLLVSIIGLLVRSLVNGGLVPRSQVDVMVDSRDEALEGLRERIVVLTAITDRDAETIRTQAETNRLLAEAVSHLEENSETSLSILQALRPDRGGQ